MLLLSNFENWHIRYAGLENNLLCENIALERILKVKQFIKLIEEDGWVQARMRSSHRQYKHPTKSGTVTVSGKPNVDIPPGNIEQCFETGGSKIAR